MHTHICEHVHTITFQAEQIGKMKLTFIPSLRRRLHTIGGKGIGIANRRGPYAVGRRLLRFAIVI